MPEHILPERLALALDAFLLAKEGESVSRRTLATYRFALVRFLAHLAAQGITTPEDITPAHVRAYFAFLHRQSYTQHTVHDYARPVKTMLRFWHADGIMAADVMARVKMPAADRRVLPALTEAQVRALLAACDTLRDTALVLFMLDTGVRSSECCALTVADVDTTTGAVDVRQGKGGKRRTVYLGVRARRALVRYLLSRDHAAGPLFPSANDGGHLTPNGLLQVLYKVGDRAGVHVHPHVLRRTFALVALRSGMDIRRLAALLGHASLQVVRQYLDVTEHDLAQAHREHGPVDAILQRGGKR